MKLSILIPAYNEEHTIEKVLEAVIDSDLFFTLEKEIIVIDDCSQDETKQRVEYFKNNNPDAPIRLIAHDMNQGKGGAIHTGIQHATGDFVLVQDADLEYDPREYHLLLKPLVEGHADVVYGSRFMGGNPHRILFFWHSIGNRFLTFLSNCFSDLNLTDMETGYKIFRTPLLKSLKLKEKRFGFEPEVTQKIARIPGIRLYEVGISYYGRTYAEGKKIGWKDGFRAIYCILKYGLFRL